MCKYTLISNKYTLIQNNTLRSFTFTPLNEYTWIDPDRSLGQRGHPVILIGWPPSDSRASRV
jgi:hypothetical protein